MLTGSRKRSGGAGGGGGESLSGGEKKKKHISISGLDEPGYVEYIIL